MEAVQERGLANWQVDAAHSEVGFAVRHLMVANVKGRFQNLTADLQLEESDPTHSRIRVDIDAASIDTRSEQRDQHLRSADFFDAENHPRISFQSDRIERVSDDRYRVTGDLTIRGVTRQVSLDTEVSGPEKDPWGGERLGVSATTKIDRRDFGLTWNQALETGGLAVSHDVKINIELELIRQ
ncbi:MAG: YceI family protein [Gemmatimonadota bacterium]